MISERDVNGSLVNILDWRHLEVHVVLALDSASDLDVKPVFAFIKLFFGNLNINIFNFLLQSWSVLVAWQVCIVHCKFTAGHESNFDSVFGIQMIKQLLECQRALVDESFIVNRVALWDCLHGTH